MDKILSETLEKIEKLQATKIEEYRRTENNRTKNYAHGGSLAYGHAYDIVNRAREELSKREQENCNISDVNNQRELLISFCDYYAEVCNIEFNAKDYLIKSFLDKN